MIAVLERIGKSEEKQSESITLISLVKTVIKWVWLWGLNKLKNKLKITTVNVTVIRNMRIEKNVEK